MWHWNGRTSAISFGIFRSVWYITICKEYSALLPTEQFKIHDPIVIKLFFLFLLDYFQEAKPKMHEVWSSAKQCICRHNYGNQGRKPRGLGGRSPQSLRWGDGPCIRPPNILRSSVVGCARKHEKSKKGVFLVRKGSCTKGHVWHLTK